jgi:hypothetical protein
MNSLLAQLWVPTVALLLGTGMGWLGRRLLAQAEIRRMIDRLLLGENELRSARAALIRERQMRLGAQSSLRQVEVERESLVTQLRERGPRAAVRSSTDEMAAGEMMADEMLTCDLEDSMIEVTEGTSTDSAILDSGRFSPFSGSAFSEPPPRVSDVRELRRERSNDEITRRAYELWDAAGRPNGRDLHFWCQAEEELRIDPLRTAVGE